jgi:hypothetical protein
MDMACVAKWTTPLSRGFVKPGAFFNNLYTSVAQRYGCNTTEASGHASVDKCLDIHRDEMCKSRSLLHTVLFVQMLFLPDTREKHVFYNRQVLDLTEE